MVRESDRGRLVDSLETALRVADGVIEVEIHGDKRGAPSERRIFSERFACPVCGLSLPERAYYLEDREDYKAARVAFVDHVAKLMQLAGADEETAKAQAQVVLDFETRLAKASLGRLELRDPATRYNPVGLAEADALTAPMATRGCRTP